MNFKRCLLSWSGALLLAGGCHSAVEEKIDAMKESGVVKLNEAGVIDYADLSPMDDLPTEIGGRDPVEGFNRAMFATNDVFMRYLFRPVGYVYGSIFPEPAVMAFNRFTDNLGFPARMISAFCQARFQAGGIEFVRFLGNTTIGIVGFFDPATAWFDLPRQDSDFGQAFASWGIGPGCYLFLPGAGPTNVRDGVGKIFDYALDPKTYFYGGQAFTMLNKGMTSYRDYETLVYANFDPYLQMRDLSLLTRRMQLERWKPETTALPEAQPAPAGPVQLADYPEQGGDVNTAHYYVQVVDYLNEMTKALMHITRPAFEHIDNNHEGLSKEQAKDLMAINDDVESIYRHINLMLREGDFSEIETVLTMRDQLFESIADAIKSELTRINEARSNTKASMLYLTILTETKNMVLQSRNLLKSQQYFLKHLTGPKTWIK